MNSPTNPTIKYLYLRDPKNSARVIAVARTVDHEARQIHYALAICSPEDLYKKEVSRTIASGRLLHTDRAKTTFCGTIPLGEETPVRAVVTALYANDPRPCVKRAALNFLSV